MGQRTAEVIRIGVIGCGRVMRGPYMRLAEQLRFRGLVEVVAACDLSEQALQEVGEQYNIPRLTKDYREVVDADDVDLVLVVTSMPAHGPIARAALEAGK
ncbi:MAG: Gfo/Idh/MocA family oxidoreductase, partial [Chloroflexi bacterium]|nr:Gfo/Idh/MocA family oxidoreductase [Chloroflexota bacterium]